MSELERRTHDLAGNKYGEVVHGMPAKAQPANVTAEQLKAMSGSGVIGRSNVQQPCPHCKGKGRTWGGMYPNIFKQPPKCKTCKGTGIGPTEPNISLCPNCHCMTKTIDWMCGKCGAPKSNYVQPTEPSKCPTCGGEVVTDRLTRHNPHCPEEQLKAFRAWQPTEQTNLYAHTCQPCDSCNGCKLECEHKAKFTITTSEAVQPTEKPKANDLLKYNWSSDKDYQLAVVAFREQLQPILAAHQADLAARDAAWIKAVEELIGEDEDDFNDFYTERNNLRAEQRTKLAKMQEKQ